MEKGQNLTINGSGNYPGGRYDKVSIRGEGTIESNVECSTFHIYGTSEALENVKAGSVKVIGETEVMGKMDSGDMLVMGTLSIAGESALKKIKILGTLEVGERLSGETANIKGSISAGGDVEYEKFDLSGGFEIKGLLNADTINIALRFGNSSAEEIGGEKISIKRKTSLLPFVKDEGSLVVKVIEGDEVFLENTKADIVRGKLVKIGSGCQIGRVEYSTDFIQDKHSTVKMSEKI
ncbi:cytoplasmic protein [Bacillus sp. S3]|uniref:cytoplasmic protein n=1 Tax=Bacillus sp. S3 TaxID=486398 RepID=UPI00118A7AFC|nr:cytoplasmic protein [Bacillus sp. S3]QCJ40704.1 cytoplasmic protein [Bacillus sp. S3]